MTLSLAILGAGRIGQVHAQAIAANADARLVAVADALPEAAAAVARSAGAEVKSIDEIEADASIDAVVICTPTDTHATLIERFARAGKAIFCEKPVDLDADRVRACLKVVEESGATLMVGFNRRFDPHIRALKRSLDEGAVGRIEQVTITSRDPSPPPHDYVARSGGIFRDMTIHDFDIARFLLPAPVARVLAVGRALVDPELDTVGDIDTATVLLEAEDGTQVVISNSRRATYGYDQRIEVHGSNGMASTENLRDAVIVVADGAGVHRPVFMDFFMTRYQAAYATEISEFVAAVSSGDTPPVTGNDGLEALRLADAAALSLSEARWVDL